MPETEPGDLSDKAVLFQAYVDLINSERETIWARHNALLVANSLIVGAIAISPTALWSHRWAALGLLGAGFLITIIWLLITIHGWLVLQRHVELASAFAMTHFRHWANPFSQAAYRRSGMWIHTLALMLIGVFVLIYLGLGYFRLIAGG